MPRILLSFLHSLSYLSLKMLQRGRLSHPHFLDEEAKTETVMPQASREGNLHLNLNL